MGWNRVSNLPSHHLAINTNVRESMYVRVTGALKAFGNKRYINATHIRVASDPHEVYFHVLEAIAVTLMNDRLVSCTDIS